MEQRTYLGNVAPDGLADYLVQLYNGQGDLLAQKLGQGDTLVVQIGRDRNHRGTRNAVTIGIHRAQEGGDGLVVTMGEQQWITPELATYAVMMGLISVLFTPWALFALIWPLSSLLGSRVLPGQIWDQIQTYVMSQGGVPGAVQPLAHPHLGGPWATPAAQQSFAQPPAAATDAQPPAAAADEGKTQKLNDPRTS